MSSSRAQDASIDLVEELLAQWLEADTAEQPRVLAELCAGHPDHAPELRRRSDALARLGLAKTRGPALGIPERLGDFELRERLGGGGMGVVHRAWQRSLQREVALKLIRPELVYFPRARERFRREAEAIARLSHPSIVPIHQFGEESGVPYFAMELIEGAPLGQVLDSLRSRAPESLRGEDLRDAVLRLSRAPAPAASAPLFAGAWREVVLRVVREVALALEHAHSRGVLHRDVKPSNIAVGADGRVFLFDFGLTLSASEERMTRSGAAVGTLLYMSPEQLTGANAALDARTDVYSLGATLYELLTLQAPFSGADSLQIQTAVLDGRIDSMRARNRAIDVDTETVCRMALACEPERRFATAAEFADDLGALLEQRPIRARAPGRVESFLRWARRRRALTAVSAAAVVLALGAPLALWRQSSRHAELLGAQLVRERELRELADEQTELARAARSRALDAEERATAALERVLEERGASEATLSFVVDLLAEARPEVAGTRDLTVRELIPRGDDLIARKLHGQPWVASRAAWILGRLHDDFGDRERALASQQLALQSASALDSSLDISVVTQPLAELGDLHLNAGRLDEADRCAQDVLALAIGADPLSLAQRVGGLLLATTVAMRRGRTEQALELTLELERLSETLGVSFANRRALNGVATFLVGLGQPARALLLAERSLVQGSNGSPREELELATAHLVRGVAAQRLGRIDDARLALGCARELAENHAISDPNLRATVLANLGSLELQQGDAALAEPYLRAAYSVVRAELGPRHPVYDPALASLARVTLELGRWEESFELHSELLERQSARSGPDSPEAAGPRLALARCSEERGELDAALEQLQRAASSFEDAGQFARALAPLRDVARIEQGLGHVDRSLDALESALTCAARADRLAQERAALEPLFDACERSADQAQRARAIELRARLADEVER
mgnify:CR=1 FL=1